MTASVLDAPPVPDPAPAHPAAADPTPPDPVSADLAAPDPAAPDPAAPDPAAPDPAAPDLAAPDLAAPDLAAADPGPDGRSVVVDLEPGPDGPLAILTMLRGRRYDVVDVRVERRGARMTVSVDLPASRMPVLLERLRRIPVVLEARAA